FTLFMQHLKEQYPKKYKRFFATILPIYVGYKCKIIREQNMKYKLMHHYVQAIRDLNTEEMQQFFADIAHKMDGDFHAEVIARVNAHKENGYHTMIVSGAFTPLLAEINKAYGIDTLIGTDIPAPEAKLDHVHAERKTDLIHAYTEGKDIRWTESFAYGDSIADLSVLELVGHPIAVAPDDELGNIAKERNWEIIP